MRNPLHAAALIILPMALGQGRSVTPASLVFVPQNRSSRFFGEVSLMTQAMNENLTAMEVAAELRCSKAQVYKLMNGEVKNRTKLPHIALGRKKVIRRSSFEAWKQDNETGTILSDSEMKAVGAVI